MVAYAFHLAIHCIHMIVTWRKGFFLPLWSAPVQLPLLIILYAAYPAQQTDGIVQAILVMIAVMLSNLLIMHWATSAFPKR